MNCLLLFFIFFSFLIIFLYFFVVVNVKSMGESQFSVLPLPLSFAHSRERKGCPNSCFDRGVGLRGRG